MFICNCKARLGYPRVPNICDSSITNSKSSALCTQAENDIELADVLTFVGSVTNLHYLITVLTGRANRFGKILLALCLDVLSLVMKIFDRWPLQSTQVYVALVYE